MKTASAKAKGRKLQQLVRDKLRSVEPSLKSKDVMSTPMGVNAEDVTLSPAAEAVLGPLYVECKNCEKINIIGTFQETKEKAKGKVPVIAHKRNHTEPIIVISLDYYIELLKKVHNK